MADGRKRKEKANRMVNVYGKEKIKVKVDE